MSSQPSPSEQIFSVELPVNSHHLSGDLILPAHFHGVVLFAHGSGSSRHSPRNRYVARTLREAGLGTFLLDLLTPEEEQLDAVSAHLRFDIPLLADRLVLATDWVAAQPQTRGHKIGYFGASTGGGAALVAAARRPELVDAVVSRGGRPDLAEDALPLVHAPTLLLVGERDLPVIQMNRHAMARMKAPARLEIVPGATHLFEEPGTLEEVASLAQAFFLHQMERTEERFRKAAFREQRSAFRGRGRG